MDDSVNFTSTTLLDQGCKKTLKSGKAKEKAREGNEGVSISLHRLVVEESTRRGERDIVKVLHFAVITRIPPVTVFRNTPSEVEVGACVEEGGSEAKDENVEEGAQLPVLPPLLHLLPQLSHTNAITSSLLLIQVNRLLYFSGFDQP